MLFRSVISRKKNYRKMEKSHLLNISIYVFFLNNNFFLCLNLIPSCASHFILLLLVASSKEHCCPICTKLCNIHQHNIVINLYLKKFPSDIYIIYVTRNLEVCCFLSSLLLQVISTYSS